MIYQFIPLGTSTLTLGTFVWYVKAKDIRNVRFAMVMAILGLDLTLRPNRRPIVSNAPFVKGKDGSDANGAKGQANDQRGSMTRKRDVEGNGTWNESFHGSCDAVHGVYSTTKQSNARRISVKQGSLLVVSSQVFAELLWLAFEPSGLPVLCLKYWKPLDKDGETLRISNNHSIFERVVVNVIRIKKGVSHNVPIRTTKTKKTVTEVKIILIHILAWNQA